MRVFLIRFRVVLVMEIRCIFSKLFSKLLQEKKFERNCPRLRRGISNFNESFRSWITTRGHFGGTYTPEEVLKKEVIPDLGKWVNNRVVNGGEKKIKEDKKKKKNKTTEICPRKNLMARGQSLLHGDYLQLVTSVTLVFFPRPENNMGLNCLKKTTKIYTLSVENSINFYFHPTLPSNPYLHFTLFARGLIKQASNGGQKRK